MLEVIGDAGPAVLLLPGGAEAVDGFFPGMIGGLRADPCCRIILYDRPGASRLPRVPSVVVTADRTQNDPIRMAHARLADALGAPVRRGAPSAKRRLHSRLIGPERMPRARVSHGVGDGASA